MVCMVYPPIARKGLAFLSERESFVHDRNFRCCGRLRKLFPIFAKEQMRKVYQS